MNSADGKIPLGGILEIRRGKKERNKPSVAKNIMSASATQGGHKEEEPHEENITACPLLRRPNGGHNN